MSAKDDEVTDDGEPSGEPSGQGASAPPPSIRTATRQLYRNTVSYVGMAVMVAALGVIVFALLSQLTVDQPSPYVGIFTYLIFPSALFFGGALFLFGMRREAKRRRKAGSAEAKPFPIINFNRVEHRRWLLYAILVGLAVFSTTGTATYNAYVYTADNEFCGLTCHTPMEPEYTAYLDSPHARVPCVDCHVGSGTSFFVKAKVNGAMQVLKLLLDSYDRPIPISTHDLRPARDTCETCHWSEKSYGAKLKQIPHYRYDESNTAEQISFTMLVGGGSRAHGQGTGIHWHMMIDNVVTYAALDHELQKIPWTEVKHADGKVTRYVSRSMKLSQEKVASLETRTMDCMDCHNRPAHTFPVPDRAIDEALYRGLIDDTLPWIKQVAVDMINLHDDHESKKEDIARDVIAHYQKQLPDVFAKRQADIEQAARVAADVWKRSAFPDMRLTWKTYPSNIGHRYWAGCFRCHGGDLVSEDGTVLDNSCDGLCHTAPVRGALGGLGEVDPMADGDNWHPWEQSAEHLKIEAHQHVPCQQCHEAGRRPASECRDCHGAGSVDE